MNTNVKGGCVTVDVRGLDFRYERDQPLVLDDLEFQLEAGCRCLLVGANGAGKSTLLEILGGRHMVPQERVRVLGSAAFHDTRLARRVAYVGRHFPLTVDVEVRQMLERRPYADPKRVARLIEALGVDLGWHMHRVSDGQRRRVQLLLCLMVPRELLLLDEITSDLDVVARADLLQLLREDTEKLGTTLFYATHVFDGLEEWATHLMHLHQGRIQRHASLAELKELQALRAQGASSRLWRLVAGWLRAPPKSA